MGAGFLVFALLAAAALVALIVVRGRWRATWADAARRGAGLGASNMNVDLPIRRRLVLVGNGMAGVRALEEILARAPGHASPSPCSAPSRTATTTASCCRRCWPARRHFADIVTHDRAWYEQNGIELIAGEAVVAIDRDDRIVTGANGTTRPYDVLILATGSNPVDHSGARA